MNKRSNNAGGSSHDASHHQGLGEDLATLETLLERRKLLQFAVSTMALIPFSTLLQACGGTATTDVVAGGDGSPVGSCSKIPEETAGPYPGNGSNGKNVLTTSGVVRSDIRSSLSGGSTAAGVPLTVTLTLVDTNNGCAPLAGYVVYLWHCDQNGAYSMYSSSISDETYLRGVQAADESGNVTFTTIFPGCYDGRWPHMHFEIYKDLPSATNSSNKIATSQLAMPKASCDEAYAAAGYATSASNLTRTSLSSDNVFSDGSDTQVAKLAGSVSTGFTATLVVGVSA